MRSGSLPTQEYRGAETFLFTGEQFDYKARQNGWEGEIRKSEANNLKEGEGGISEVRRVKELQRPTSVDLEYLGQLIRARIHALGYREEEEHELASNLTFLYEFAVQLIQRTNVVADQAAPDDPQSLATAVTDIRVSVEHMRRTFMKSAMKPLSRFAKYLYALGEKQAP